MAELRAPRGDGEVLAVPGFDEVPRLVEENRRKLDRTDVMIGGMPLRELRALARREVLEAASPLVRIDELSGPLLLAGHQPELSHPGVWVKNFALNGLAKKLGGIPLNLIVDNDTLKSTSLRFPVFRDHDPDSVRLESVAFDQQPARERTFEGSQVRDEAMFCEFPNRVRTLWANWGYEPLLPAAWAKVLDGWPGLTVTDPRWTYGAPIPPRGRCAGNIGHMFTTARQAQERLWGCENTELSVSWLSHSVAYTRFLWQLFTDLPRFQDIYNAAVKRYRRANGIRSNNHPVPELSRDGEWLELPFWWDVGRGQRARPFIGIGEDFRWRSWLERNESFPISRDLNQFLSYVPKYLGIFPRALTLTLFARVCLGDFFIHGIGGGKYDEVTDAIIRDYFGIEPPAYQVLSATLHLPLPGFPSTDEDLHRAERRLRDLHWNPQRYLRAGQASSLSHEKAALATAEPPMNDHAARKVWFRELQHVNEQLRPHVWKQVPVAKAQLARIRAEVHANEVLKRRDYSWVLYPEETLRPFLQRFLEV